MSEKGTLFCSLFLVLLASYELLYSVDGGSIDWMYAANKTFAYVIEVNNDSQGFQPSYGKWRDKTVERQRAGWMYILDKMSENRAGFK